MINKTDVNLKNIGRVNVIFDISDFTSANNSKPIKKKFINLIDLKAFANLNILLNYDLYKLLYL